VHASFSQWPNPILLHTPQPNPWDQFGDVMRQECVNKHTFELSLFGALGDQFAASEDPETIRLINLKIALQSELTEGALASMSDMAHHPQAGPIALALSSKLWQQQQIQGYDSCCGRKTSDTGCSFFSYRTSPLSSGPLARAMLSVFDGFQSLAKRGQTVPMLPVVVPAGLSRCHTQ
jgi:hypothetical protein